MAMLNAKDAIAPLLRETAMTETSMAVMASTERFAASGMETTETT
jgi:hypothetical protein